ncbi:MAG TPA: hypothetical protein VFC99_14600 [Acidimicrobiia bacterium]|nr:hypothetical protein [Acidimicrobiia bacterium]
MPRSDRSVPRRRRQFGAVAEGVALLAFTAAIAVPAALAGASSFGGRPVSAPTDRVVVCDSGIVHQGDVSTSSLVVVRVPDGAAPTVPSGCTEG